MMMNAMKQSITLLCLAIACAGHAQELLQQDFYSNGHLKSTRFSDGANERFITYYESGRVKEMGAFREGRRDGVWKQLDENGALLAQATFAQGHRQGVWEFRDNSNQLMGRLQYSNGQLARGEQYDPRGELLAQRQY